MLNGPLTFKKEEEGAHLRYIDGNIVFIICPVAESEAQLLLTVHAAQLNLLYGQNNHWILSQVSLHLLKYLI